jgi:hypothetical protein
VVEPIVRGLLLDEGRVVAERPVWARSRRQADLFLQLEEWMLFIGCRDRVRPGRYSIVTAVNGPVDNTWRTAWRRGYISTPPPLPGRRGRPSLLVSIARGLEDRRPAEGLLAAVARAHTRRREIAQAAYDRALVERWRSTTTRCRRSTSATSTVDRGGGWGDVLNDMGP